MKATSPQCAKCTVSRCRTKEKGKKVPPSCPTEKYPDLVRVSIKKISYLRTWQYISPGVKW